MLLSDLIRGLDIRCIQGPAGVDIAGIAYDSRKIKSGFLFVCKGFDFKPGYALDAIKRGASAIVHQAGMLPDSFISEAAVFIQVEDSRYALACISAEFYGHPSKRCRVIGITGTKGKTTITYMIKSILEAAGRKTGLIGGIRNIIGDEIMDAETTTPESLDLQKLLAHMVDKGATDVIVEVSSQGLQLSRVACVEFHTGVLTNVVSDHIGPREHKDFDEYLTAKLKLFSMCSWAVINSDSPFAEAAASVASSAGGRTITYGLNANAAVRAVNINNNPNGIVFAAITPWGREDIEMRMIGGFNVINALAAITVCCNLGVNLQEAAAGLENVTVKGRVEIIPIESDYIVMTDFAHNKISLESVLTELRNYYGKRRLVCIFGCSGFRDVARRFEMGEVSGRIADFTVITSDDPRTEDPALIAAEIETGVRKSGGHCEIVIDRIEAIRYAMKNAKKDDVLLIAGKGHERYQLIGDEKIPYDEREIVKSIFLELQSDRGGI